LTEKICNALRDLRRDCHDYPDHVSRSLALALADAIDEAPPLFQNGDFKLNNGTKSTWKIECDALTVQDWAGLAAIAVQFLPEFGLVAGVPRGGVLFAGALSRYAKADCSTVLLAEDVCTTGESIERWKRTLIDDPQALWATDRTKFVGVCVFARDRYPTWVTPLFRMPKVYTVPDDGE
jgi:hypothetical protein